MRWSDENFKLFFTVNSIVALGKARFTYFVMIDLISSYHQCHRLMSIVRCSAGARHVWGQNSLNGYGKNHILISSASFLS